MDPTINIEPNNTGAELKTEPPAPATPVPGRLVRFGDQVGVVIEDLPGDPEARCRVGWFTAVSGPIAASALTEL